LLFCVSMTFGRSGELVLAPVTDIGRPLSCYYVSLQINGKFFFPSLLPIDICQTKDALCMRVFCVAVGVGLLSLSLLTQAHRSMAQTGLVFAP